jgi:hypothetical protein
MQKSANMLWKRDEKESRLFRRPERSGQRLQAALRNGKAEVHFGAARLKPEPASKLRRVIPVKKCQALALLRGEPAKSGNKGGTAEL